MGLFAVDYQNVEDQCVYAQGGLKFRADEDRLMNYFKPILSKVTLNDLIGEAVYWTLLPQVLIILIFPFLLSIKGFLFAGLLSLAFYIVLDFLHLNYYFKFFNYFSFIFGNPIMQVLYYLAWGVIFYKTQRVINIYVIGSFLLLINLGLFKFFSSIILFYPVSKYFLPPSDQVLRKVGWYYGRKNGQNPTTWTMKKS